MEVPLLYRQLQDQLSQWAKPKDKRHLTGFAEIVAAVLQSGEACLGRWIPYLAHRDCSARAHMGRLSYFLHNPQITAERYYEPILRHLLSTLAGEAILLTLDTSMLWDRFCLIEVCLAWGGRSFTLAQVVLEHGSAMVGFEQYRPVLERAQRVLPSAVAVTDRFQKQRSPFAKAFRCLEIKACRKLFVNLRNVGYERLPLPILQALPKCNPPPACASQCKRDALDCRIEFSRVVTFSY